MGYPTIEYIRGLRKTLETKKAEIVGTAPSSLPGAEHDTKPPAEAKKPDPETKDQTMVPNSGLSTSGAGDDSKITHTNDLVAGEAALTPTKKPEVTGDADAKTAEALAAELLTGINAWYAAKKTAEQKTAAEQKPAEQQAATQQTTEQKTAAEQTAATQQTAAQPPATQQTAEQKTAAEQTAATQPPATQQAATQQTAEQKTAAGTPPAAGAGTAEALITDKGKEPEQLKNAVPPTKKPEVTADAQAPATGEGSTGETAAAAKAAEGAVEECKDGKCGKCAKCKAAAAAKEAKAAGALDMELTSDVLAKIAAVMLATEEGTKLAESVLAKAAGAEAAEKTLNFLREQNELAQKQAEYKAGQRDALALILKRAADEAGTAGATDAAAADDGGITEIADTLDAMVEAGEITEDEADQVVVELAQALAGEAQAAPADTATATATATGTADAKTAQAMPDATAAGNAAIDSTVAVDPAQLDPNSVPQGDMGDITPEDVAGALDSLVESGEITEQEAEQLVQELVGGTAGADGDVSPEEIANALQAAVASGELTPADVQQVLSELEGVPAPEEGAAAAPAATAAPAAADAAAAAAPAAAATASAPTDEPKTAGAKLLAAINAARAAKATAAK